MEKPLFKILSIDGGGIKGILPCTILKAIEERTGYATSEMFHLIAGTSTGGIIGLGLSKPNDKGGNAFSASDMLDMYMDEGADIFSKRQEDLWSRIGSILKTTQDVTKNNYDVSGIRKILARKFGKVTLKEALTDLLITTYDLNRGKPFYFSSRLAKQTSKENLLMREIARSTSAAPTFFEPSLLQYDSDKNVAFVDGGVFANNPSILAYSEAKELWKIRITKNAQKSVKAGSKAFLPVVTADDFDLPFYLLSIGCGSSPSRIDFSNAKQWRTVKWVKPLLTDIFMRGVEESTDFTMHHLMPPYKSGAVRYDRIDIVLPSEHTAMDNVSTENIQGLAALANRFVKKNSKRIDQICNIIAPQNDNDK